MDISSRKLDFDLLKRLKNLEVPDNFLEIADSIFEDTMNVYYQNLICWMSEKLRYLCNLECCVNAVVDNADDLSFGVEVNSLLRELGCPYDSLLVGHISQRFQTVQNKQLLLEFLITELCGAKITYSRRHRSDDKMVVKLKQSRTAKNLKAILVSLGFTKPPPAITVKMLFSRVGKKIKDLLAEYSIQIYRPLFSGFLSQKQWYQLGMLRREMGQDYKNRRMMLIERLNLTIQSFCWSSKRRRTEIYDKNVREKIAKIYDFESNPFPITPSVCIGDILAARTDFTVYEKTSGNSVRNIKSSIYSVLIGPVPDRGGRPNELPPPPRDMPSWQKPQLPPQKPNVRPSSGRNLGNVKNYESRSDHFSQQNNANYNNSRHNTYQEQHQVENYSSNVQNTGYTQYNPYQVHEVNPYQGTGGFGGYGATGGNFQQYGVVQPHVEQQMPQFLGNQRSNRGFLSRGGRQQRRPRGNYGHQQYRHQ